MIAENKLPRTLMQAVKHFDPDTAAAYVASIKWPNGPVCPRCESQSIGHIRSRNRYQCRECRKQFSLLTDTIFEGTHLGLDQWCAAVWMLINCRMGVSSCEIARTIGCKQQSAWHVLHRVRHIIAEGTGEKLSGVVEADSTLVGGILKNMPRRRRKVFANQGRLANKTIVHAFKERATGEIRAAIIQDENRTQIKELIEKNVEEGSFLHTDSSGVYMHSTKEGKYSHASVNHAREEYVRGDVHVNGCESFFNALRRGLKGVYVHTSPEHLDSYVQEAVHRFNIRKESEWVRFDGAMRKIVGKRLTYSELTGGAVR